MTIGKRSKANVDKVRRKVFDRDGGCVVQGTAISLLFPCMGVWTIQHRVNRQMGGSAEVDGMAFLITMCARHNQLDASHAQFREMCMRNGWSVPRWVLNSKLINEVPVKYIDGWYTLGEGYREAIDAVKAERIIGALYDVPLPTQY